MSNIAVFASGGGTNAENIILYFREKKTAGVGLIVCSNPGAGVLKRAAALGVHAVTLSDAELVNGTLARVLEERNIGFIALAGFMKMVPPEIVAAFSGRIVNIHPALLPKFGGKGMFGMNVHRAVKASGDRETGITVHYVNEKYDEGRIIFQAKVTVEAGDTAEHIAARVKSLELEHYPVVIELLVKSIRH